MVVQVSDIAPNTLDLEGIEPIPVEGIPNHRASSGERGTAGEGSKRPGIFGAGKGSGRAPRTKKAEVPPLAASVKDDLTKMYALAGMGVMPFDPILAGVILEQAPICAEAVFNAAQENESLRRVIVMLTTGGMWAGLIAAHLPILLTATARHAPNEGAKNMGANAMMMVFQRDVRDVEEHDPSGVAE